MAGNFTILAQATFTNQTTFTVTHNLDRLQIGVLVRIGDVARNDLIESVAPDPANPRRGTVITLTSQQSGIVVFVDTDFVFEAIPTPENTAVLSGGTAMTANVYDPTNISADAFARANHTGTQTASTISDFDTEVTNNAAVTANTSKVTNATHSGDVTGSVALTIAVGVVTNAKLANMATARIKGRATAGTGDPEDLTGTQVTTLLDTFTSVLQGVAPASGGGTANFLRADGSWVAPGGGGITGPGTSVDKGRVTWNGTGGTAVADVGLRDYGSSATDPTSPTPADGDSYWNSVLKMQMCYDGGRSKWLSVNTSELAFGRNGNTGDGAYYRGTGNGSFSATRGRNAEYNGTVVSLTYTRADTDAATFEAVADGVAIGTVASSALGGKDLTLDGDFTADQVLGARNQTGGNVTNNVQGWIVMRWRA
jgi:hypothetical protein